MNIMGAVSHACANATKVTEIELNKEVKELRAKEACIKDLTQLLLQMNKHTKDGKVDSKALLGDPVVLKLVDSINKHSPEVLGNVDLESELSKDEIDSIKENARLQQKDYDIDISHSQKILSHLFDMHKAKLDMMKRIHDILDQMFKEMAKVGK